MARADPFAAFRDALQKRIGAVKARVASAKPAKGEITDSISTGLTVLDNFVIGGGGLPCRRMTEIASEEGLGKSTLLYSAIAQAQAAGCLAAIFETERRVDRRRLTQLGIDLDRLMLFEPRYLEELVEDLFQVIDSVPKRGVPAIIGWDSLAATPIKDEYENGLSGSQANRDRARMLAQAIRSLADKVAGHNVALVIVNQLRKGTDGFGNASSESVGGDALKFYATVRLRLLGGKSIKKGAYHIGKAPVVMSFKNLIVDPFRKARAFLVYGEGWSDDRTLLEFGKDNGMLEKEARMGQENLDRVREIVDLAEWDPLKFEEVTRKIGAVDGDEAKQEEGEERRQEMTAVKKKAKPAIVKREPDDPPDEILAKHIVEISESMRRLMAGPLKEHTIVLLIYDAIGTTKGVGKRDIAKVLNAIENLAHRYLKRGLKR
jgi:recombination protein RecA